MAIDVGAACINRTAGSGDGYTHIGIENPANATGTIDYVCVYVYANITALEIASFVDEGSNVLSTNDDWGISPNPIAGENIYNAPGDFTAFNINAGEYIGAHCSAGTWERSNDGSGYWYVASDQIPCSSVTFLWAAERTQSVYATGTEVVIGNPYWYYKMMRRQ